MECSHISQPKPSQETKKLERIPNNFVFTYSSITKHSFQTSYPLTQPYPQRQNLSPWQYGTRCGRPLTAHTSRLSLLSGAPMTGCRGDMFHVTIRGTRRPPLGFRGTPTPHLPDRQVQSLGGRGPGGAGGGGPSRSSEAANCKVGKLGR